MTDPTQKTPAGNRRLQIVVAIAVIAAIAGAVYGIAPFKRNAGDAACSAAMVKAKQLSPLIHGEIAGLQRASAAWPKDAVQFLGVSLDSKPEEVTGVVNRMNIAWPVFFDGRGWASPLVRSLGINRLPTVWLIDREGKLRSLRGAENATDQVRELLRGQ